MPSGTMTTRPPQTVIVDIPDDDDDAGNQAIRSLNNQQTVRPYIRMDKFSAILICIGLVFVAFFLLRSISIRYEPITFNVHLFDSPIRFHYMKDQTMKNANFLKGLHMNPHQPVLERKWMEEFLDTDK